MHDPTRTCPHRLCRPVHAALVAVGLVFLAEVLTQGHSLAALAFLALSSVIILGIFKLINHRSMVAVIRDDAAPAGTVFTLRKGWARFAVALDIFYLVTTALLTATTPFAPSGSQDASVVPPMSAYGLTTVFLGFGMVALETYAHRRAIRSAEPAAPVVLAKAP